MQHKKQQYEKEKRRKLVIKHGIKDQVWQQRYQVN